eukprot:SAG11_NODE_3780_length_2231_cov_1.947467_3_plen_304_part_00
MVMKIIALGFISGKHSYLRNLWNVADFLLVVSSYAVKAVEYFFEEELLNPSILRVVRCLRPLRTAGFVGVFLKSCSGCVCVCVCLCVCVFVCARVCVSMSAGSFKAAMKHWHHLLNIVALLLFTLGIFGVFGVQLFGGALSQFCAPQFQSHDEPMTPERLKDYNLQHMTEWIRCAEGLLCGGNVCGSFPADETEWWGYDNIAQALITGWVATAGELWTVNMPVEFQTRSLRYPKAAWASFILLFFVMNMVISNLFVAVIVEAFISDQKSTQDDEAMKRKLLKLVLSSSERLQFCHLSIFHVRP